MLHRALLNVVSNAVKFSREGGVVEICGVSQDGHRDIVVRDHGIGIPAAELDRLGTRFFRASNAIHNEIAGTGLGLRIMQTIIDNHSGEVVIDSEEGVGTTVWVRLDRYADGMPAPMPHELVEAEERLAEELIARERLAAPAREGGEPVDAGGPRIVPAFPRRR
jgi:two-component system OmpR family sensor kinase